MYILNYFTVSFITAVKTRDTRRDFSILTKRMAQMVKNLPAMQETQVQSLGREDPLEKGMVTHFSVLAWRIPPTDRPGRLPSKGSQRVRPGSATTFSLQERNGNVSISKIPLKERETEKDKKNRERILVLE